MIRKNTLLISIILCLACLVVGGVVGRYLLPADSGSQADYYRGIYDLCRFMVAASGDYVDCNKMTSVAHDYEWFEEVSRGFSWPLD